MSNPPADLRIRWSKRERALLYCYERDKPTSMLIAGFIEDVRVIDVLGLRGATWRKPSPSDERTLAQELDARGYDLTTMRFSIRKKATTT